MVVSYGLLYFLVTTYVTGVKYSIITIYIAIMKYSVIIRIITRTISIITMKCNILAKHKGIIN